MRTTNEDNDEIIGNKQKLSTIPGFHGRIKGGGATWAVAQGPPQLRGLHKKTVKNYYLRKHKILY